MNTTFYLHTDKYGNEVDYQYEVNFHTEHDHFFNIEFEIDGKLTCINDNSNTQDLANKYISEHFHHHYDDIIDACNFHFITEE
jgi:hypothetical protein